MLNVEDLHVLVREGERMTDGYEIVAAFDKFKLAQDYVHDNYRIIQVRDKRNYVIIAHDYLNQLEIMTISAYRKC